MVKKLLLKLAKNNNISQKELAYILDNIKDRDLKLLSRLSIKARKKYFKRGVYLRGLLEISNYCKHNCLYCGINCNVKNISRYRLTYEQIMASVNIAIKNNIKTIVLQGGEDDKISDDFLINIIKSIKKLGDIAITLSLGARSQESLQELFNAGATRYLLRHETARPDIYQKYHLTSTFSERINTLSVLKEIGFQTGTGFIVGLEGDKPFNYLSDLILLQEINPEMIGIGPFIPSSNTILKNKVPGSLFTCKVLLGIIRLMFPKALIPATTALATLDQNGYLIGLNFGCNVIMPNITPIDNQVNYSIYDHKKTNELINEKIDNLAKMLLQNKWHIDFAKGDYPK